MKGLILWVALMGGIPVVCLSAGNLGSAECKVEWQKLSGRVESTDLENRQLHIRDKNGNLAHINVDGSVQIFRDWRLVALDDVRLKDRITVRRSNEGL